MDVMDSVGFAVGIFWTIEMFMRMGQEISISTLRSVPAIETLLHKTILVFYQMTVIHKTIIE